MPDSENIQYLSDLSFGLKEEELIISRGGRCDRGCNEYYTMAYVPVEHLICLEEMPTFNGFNDSVALLSSSDEEKESCCKKLIKSMKEQ